MDPDKGKDGKNNNPTISTRLSALKNVIDEQIDKISKDEHCQKDLIEVIYMYYDEV